jgi:hypothetical protein
MTKEFRVQAQLWKWKHNKLPGPSNYQTQPPTGGRHLWKIKNYNLHDSLHVQTSQQAQFKSIQISDKQKYKIPYHINNNMERTP